jgi:hypothetical protein
VLLITLLSNHQALSTQYTSSPINTSKIKKFIFRPVFTQDGIQSGNFAAPTITTDVSISVGRCLNSGECVMVNITDNNSTVLVARRLIDFNQPNGEIHWTTGYGPKVDAALGVSVQVSGFQGMDQLEVSVRVQGVDP